MSSSVIFLLSRSNRLLCLYLAVLTVCGGCRYDPHAGDYASYSPPRDELYGIWSIDGERTTWRDLTPLLQSGDIDPKRGYLELKSDGHFLIDDLPDISLRGCYPIVPHQSGSGKWWIGPGAGDGLPYIWLDYREVDGEAVEDKNAALYFRHEASQWFLQAIILDPDSGDVLVMKKDGKR